MNLTAGADYLRHFNVLKYENIAKSQYKMTTKSAKKGIV